MKSSSLLCAGLFVCCSVIGQVYGSVLADKADYALECNFPQKGLNASIDVYKQHLDNKKCPAGVGVCSKERDKNTNIDSILVRWTAGYTADEAIKTLQSRGVSYHFLVDENGKVLELVENPKENVAFSAGKCEYRGFKNLNQTAIQIGVVTPGYTYDESVATYVKEHATTYQVVEISGAPEDWMKWVKASGAESNSQQHVGFVKYSGVQLTKAAFLVQALKQKYGISDYNVFFGSDLWRKNTTFGDPGPLFTQYFADYGLIKSLTGLELKTETYKDLTDADYKEILKAYGYASGRDSNRSDKDIWRAFNSRYYHEDIKDLTELSERTKVNIALLVAHCLDNTEDYDKYFVGNLAQLAETNTRVAAFCAAEGVDFGSIGGASSSSSSSSSSGSN